MTMLDVLDPHSLCSATRSDAAELTAAAVGAGDLVRARFWATEFAIHVDNGLTLDELEADIHATREYQLAKVMPT